jgi:citrate synthase
MLTAQQTAARLGVKVETVYAYVSREILSREFSSDGRTSRFDRAEVEALALRGRPRRGSKRIGTVDVSLASSITQMNPDGRLEYRGHDVRELAQGGSFEQAAELLWTGEVQPRPRWKEEPDATALRVARALPAESPAVERLAVVAAAMACSQPLRIDLQRDLVLRHARGLIQTFVASLPVVSRDASRTPGGRGVASALWPKLSAKPATRPRIRALDTALLVLADHELATSTLAARVAASTRADPFLAVVAGLAAVSGSLHGRAPAGVHRLLRRAAETPVPERAVLEALADTTKGLPGFGHPVYVGEDPRASVLLPRVLDIARARERRLIEGVARAVEEQTNSKMNIDFALGALAFVTGMPIGSTEAVFAIARTAGWVAHALEEYAEAPLRFRARALYDGVSPSP